MSEIPTHPLRIGRLLLTGPAGSRSAHHMSFQPRDSLDKFRADVRARQPAVDRNDPTAIYQGGSFVTVAPHGA